MTEREAWEALAVNAGRYRAGLERGEEGACINPVWNGLCGGIDQLRTSGQISWAISDRMALRIYRALRTRRGQGPEDARPAYLWPLTPSGFKRRAAWARKQTARRVR